VRNRLSASSWPETLVQTGFSEMFKPKLSHHRGSLNRVTVDQLVIEVNALSTQFNGFSVAPTHSEICVLVLNGPRLKVKAVHEVILSNSHCEGCTWMGGQINLREHPPKKQALIPTRNPLQSCGCMWACSSAGRAPALQESRQNHTSAASGVAYAGTRGAINLLNWTEVGPNACLRSLGAAPLYALRGFSSSECPANARTCSPSVRN
jgi:hypothetical protein